MSKTLPEVSKVFKSYHFSALDFTLGKSAVRLCISKNLGGTSEKGQNRFKLFQVLILTKYYHIQYMVFQTQ